MTPEELRAAARNFSLLGEIDQLARGHLRIETQLKYPDGSSIEVFLLSGSSPETGFSLSDLGQTTGWLLTAQVKPWLSKKRRDILEDIISVAGVRQVGGALTLATPQLNQLPATIVKLAQTCSRVADLTFTKRTALQTLAKEEVEEVLADLEFPYEADAEIPARLKNIRVDFLVRAPRATSAILTLSSMNSNSAHVAANEIFTKWYDLSDSNRPEQKVTVFDDRRDVYRDEDLRRLENFSFLLPLSDRKAISDVLAA